MIVVEFQQSEVI